MQTIPTFAVIGHPNEGKSSVVSNLTENDRIMISAHAGETRRLKEFPIVIDGRTILKFIDTPGFQHPQKILKWFENYQKEHGSADGALSSFLEEMSGNRDLNHDTALLKPINEGAAAIFVVDASHPMRKHDLFEMEVLRMIGCPRMALLNNKDRAFFLDEWKAELNRHYHIVREFNAMKSSFPERIKLLEALKAMHQEWEELLAEAIAALSDNWDARLDEVSAEIEAMLKKIVEHKESKSLDETKTNEDDLKQKLYEKYKKSISKYERRTHEAIRKLFRHDVFSGSLSSEALFGKEDLFSSETWKVLGLSRMQLAATGATALAGAGVFIDLALPGLTFGVFTVGGGLLGGISSYMGAGKLGNIRLGLRGMSRKLGGRSLQVGPLKINSPLTYILIDRALLYFDTVSHWSHARREDNQPLISMVGEQSWLTRNWSPEERKTVVDFLKEKRGNEAAKRLSQVLVGKMRSG